MADDRPQPRTQAEANAALIKWFRMKHVTAAERVGRWMIVVGLAMVLVPLLLATTGLNEPFVTRFGPALANVPVLVGIVLLIGSWFVLRVGVGRRWREARTQGFLVCLGCGYFLGKLQAGGKCPECGEGYELAEMPRRWVARWGHAPRKRGLGVDMFRPGPPWVLTADGEVRVPKEPGPARGERVGAIVACLGWIWLCIWGARAVLRYSAMRPVALSVMQWVVVGVVGVGLLAIGSFVMGVTRRRVRRQLAATDGRVCIGCRGSLAGLGESGVCPACGESFDAAELRWAWWRYGGPTAPNLMEMAERRRDEAKRR